MKYLIQVVTRKNGLIEYYSRVIINDKWLSVDHEGNNSDYACRFNHLTDALFVINSHSEKNKKIEVINFSYINR